MPDRIRRERLTLSRLNQLRQSVKGYRELEKVAAEFRGRAAMTIPARMLAMRRGEAVVGQVRLYGGHLTHGSELPVM